MADLKFVLFLTVRYKVYYKYYLGELDDKMR